MMARIEHATLQQLGLRDCYRWNQLASVGYEGVPAAGTEGWRLRVLRAVERCRTLSFICSVDVAASYG